MKLNVQYSTPCISEATIWKLSPAVLVTIVHVGVPARSAPDANVRSWHLAFGDIGEAEAPTNVSLPLQNKCRPGAKYYSSEKGIVMAHSTSQSAD